MFTQKQGSGLSHFLFPLFILLSLLGGVLLTAIAFFIGGICSILSGPADSQVTPNDMIMAIMLGYIIYLFIIGSLTFYVMRKERVSCVSHILLFIAAPLIVPYLIWDTAPFLTLVFLVIIASLAVYEAIVIHHRYRQMETSS